MAGNDSTAVQMSGFGAYGPGLGPIGSTQEFFLATYNLDVRRYFNQESSRDAEHLP